MTQQINRILWDLITQERTSIYNLIYGLEDVGKGLEPYHLMQDAIHKALIDAMSNTPIEWDKVTRLKTLSDWVNLYILAYMTAERDTVLNNG